MRRETSHFTASPVTARLCRRPRSATLACSLLCELDGRLLAYAQLRWSVAPSCVVADAPGEIRRLYVDRDCHGTGVAHDLMRACLDAMNEYRSDVVWLGVWEQNPRAIAFYKKFGFVEVGAHLFSVGTDAQRDIVMARPVLA